MVAKIWIKSFPRVPHFSPKTSLNLFRVLCKFLEIQLVKSGKTYSKIALLHSSLGVRSKKHLARDLVVPRTLPLEPATSPRKCFANERQLLQPLFNFLQLQNFGFVYLKSAKPKFSPFVNNSFNFRTITIYFQLFVNPDLFYQLVEGFASLEKLVKGFSRQILLYGQDCLIFWTQAGIVLLEKVTH